MMLYRALMVACFIAALLGSWRIVACALPAHAEENQPFDRSSKVWREFEKATGYPLGRPGYVADHIIPLACGGPDEIYNLQWESIADGKIKDGWERKECRTVCDNNSCRLEGCCSGVLH